MSFQGARLVSTSDSPFFMDITDTRIHQVLKKRVPCVVLKTRSQFTNDRHYLLGSIQSTDCPSWVGSLPTESLIGIRRNVGDVG